MARGESLGQAIANESRSVIDAYVRERARQILPRALDREVDAFLAFYDSPAKHQGHVQTTNPIETTFAPIRLRHLRTQGSGVRNGSLTMMYKFLAQAASRRWRRLNWHHQLVPGLEERLFTDGVLQNAA